MKHDVGVLRRWDALRMYYNMARQRQKLKLALKISHVTKAIKGIPAARGHLPLPPTTLNKSQLFRNEISNKMLGKLVHLGFDALLISAFLAGVKRSTGLTCVSLELAE